MATSCGGSAVTSYSLPAAAPATKVTPESTVRYAQMLYSSFDDVSGVGGGWQVKDELGGLTAAERDALTARVVTKFDVDPALPEYPTTDQIADRPARLAYGTLSPTVAGYWHTAAAGADATGRPGNVMAHVLLDRDVRLPSTLRPIQLWRSPDWRRPYGAAEVLATKLSSDRPPAPNPEITASASIDFLIGTTVDRQGVFRVLLDAVYSAMSGGPKVVLVTSDQEHGPKWLAAISFFMSPGSARRFSWSTFDRAEQAAIDLARGVDVVVIPRESAADLDHRDWVIIDEDDEPTVRELGAAHTTRHAQIVVTPWSTLTEGVLGDDESTAVALLARQDAIALEIGDYGLSPLWPLAVAVLGSEELDEFHDEARRAVADEAPVHLPLAGPMSDLVADAAEATAPTDMNEALERLRTAQARGGYPRAADQFARIAFADPGNLEQLTLTDVERVRTVPAHRWGPLVSRILDQLEDRLPDPTGYAARRLLRVITLLDRLAVDEPESHAAEDRVRSLLTNSDLSCLGGPAAATVTGQPDIPPDVRRAILRPAVADLPSGALATMSSATWRWVMADGTGETLVLPPNPKPVDLALYPWFVDALCRDYDAADIPPGQLGDVTKDALLWALESERISDAECRQLASRLAVHAQFDSAALSDVFNRWRHRVTPAMLGSTMLYQPVSADLIALVAGLPVDPGGADPQSDSAIAAAQLRQLVTAQPLTTAVARTALEDAAPVVVANLTAEHISPLNDELAIALCAAFVAAQSTDQLWASVEGPVAQALRHRVGREAGRVVELIADLVIADLVDVDWIASQAFLSTMDGGAERPSVPFDRHRLDDVVTRLVERKAYRGPRDERALRTVAWDTVRLGTAERAEDFFQRFPRAARDWFRDHRF